MPHTCHAIDCNTKVPPEMFMCRKHWFMLPKINRNLIWSTYRIGQCDDWNPSKAYCDIAKKCVEFIARREGKQLTGKEPELVLYDVFGSQ